jgi:hypothetical protein
VTIFDFSNRGVELVQDPLIRDALSEAYRSSSASKLLMTAHRVFDVLTAYKWPTETLAQFFATWNATHGTALFVSGLVIRLQREALLSGEHHRPLLFQAASEIGEVIAEDTGIDDVPHNELFARLANHFVSDDRWKLTRYCCPASQQFREYLKHARLAAPIERAILTTAASESWNSGEYCYLDARVSGWMVQVMGYSPESVEEITAYISHHARDVELGHFVRAINSWRIYCEASGKEIDCSSIQQVFESYFSQLHGPFDAMLRILEA